MNLMLDTNVFNSLVKGKLTKADLPPGQYFATHIQRDELEATPNDALRVSLVAMFRAVPRNDIATSSFLLGISRLNEARLTSETSQFDMMLVRLADLDRKSGKRLWIDNQRRDVLVAETAIVNGLTLLTDDENSARESVAREFGGSVRRP